MAHSIRGSLGQGLRPWRLWAAYLASLHGWALWPWILEQLLLERERWFLWLPVGVGCGVAVYFALPAEPPLWLGPVLSAPVALALGREWQRAGTALPLFIAIAAVVSGLAAAQLRTATVTAPVLERRGAYVIEGEVALVEDRVRGQRLTIAAPRLEDVSPEATPAYLRFSIREADPDVRPGDRVRARAMLMPPSPPAAPGDFDYARHAFFEQLGAVGYAFGGIEHLGRAPGRDWQRSLAGVRQQVAARIGAVVPGASGAVAAALLTGLRAAIPESVWHDMQVAGIAHLLAISGLHLGLVAGTLFFAVRIAMALAPPLALRLPGKKVAALAALIGAFLYLLITGGTVPTQRAFVMTALALIAVMVDRNPFSMRLVAWAALFVLLFQPESLLGASFQMSFGAVVGLIAVYESGIGRRPEGAAGLDWTLLLYVAGVALTTVVASVATAPFAIYHFDRMPAYGIVANLIAVPLTAFWIMPLGLLGLIVLPLGLEAPCFALMGKGIGVVLAVAATVADLPGAALRIAKPPEAALVAVIAGGLWLCLWRRPWRHLGLIGPGVAVILAVAHDHPDILIERRGDLMAVRRADDRLALSPWDKDEWVTGGWLRRAGQSEPAPWPEPGAEGGHDLRCDGLGCVVSREGQRVAIARRPEALLEDCMLADLVISWPRIERCPDGAPLIGPEALWQSGGFALWLDEDGIERLSVRAHRGDRPWTR